MVADHPGTPATRAMRALSTLSAVWATSYAYFGSYGVRPAFYVESGITLSLEPDQVELSDSALLAEFTSKQLVEEVLRRIAEGQEDGDEDESEIW